MSLAPSTDLVLEVSRAADPARAAAVAEKLNALGRQGAGSPQDFAAALNAAVPAPAPAVAPSKRAQAAQTKLESVMLTEFIGEMLPKDAPEAYGQGYAGDMWRSMLAERIADQIAASGRLGIASRLFAGHPLSQSARPLAPSLAQSTPSGASAADMRDGADLFADLGAS
jgi:flagellar protein FlgJ